MAVKETFTAGKQHSSIQKKSNKEKHLSKKARYEYTKRRHQRGTDIAAKKARKQHSSKRKATFE